MSVLDQLPEGRLLASVRELDQAGKEMKSYQALGQDSVVTDRLFSRSSYDVLIPQGTSFRTVTVEFLPDETAFGGNFCYRCMVNETIVSGNVTTTYRMIRLIDDGRQRWTRTIKPEISDFRMKFFFFVIGSGTFTIDLV